MRDLSTEIFDIISADVTFTYDASSGAQRAGGAARAATRIMDLIKRNVADEPDPVRELDPVRAKALELGIAYVGDCAPPSHLFAISDRFMAYLTNTHEEDTNAVS